VQSQQLHDPLVWFAPGELLELLIHPMAQAASRS
jgi:hypothetical protein